MLVVNIRKKRRYWLIKVINAYLQRKLNTLRPVSIQELVERSLSVSGIGERSPSLKIYSRLLSLVEDLKKNVPLGMAWNAVQGIKITYRMPFQGTKHDSGH